MEHAEFECAICLDVCDNAVESSCCCTLYCKKCTHSLKTCPGCRANDFNVVPSRLARKIIGRLKMACKLCGLSIQRDSVADHHKVCEKRMLVCAARGCPFRGAKDDFFEHVVRSHKEDILKIAQGIGKTHVFQPHSADSSTQTISGTEEGASVVTAFSGLCILQQSSKSSMKSLESKPRKRGNKYYCGRPLPSMCPCNIIVLGCKEREDFGCVKGLCGPNGGHNCADCQRMDLRERGWPPGCVVSACGKKMDLRAGPQKCVIKRDPPPGCRGDCCTCKIFKILSRDPNSVYHQFR